MGLGRVKTLWRLPQSSQPPAVQLGSFFFLPILAILSCPSGPGAQCCRFGRCDDRWKQSLPSATYVRIAAMSGPGPMIFMTRVRL
jgi:hypothetical protein